MGGLEDQDEFDLRGFDDQPSPLHHITHHTFQNTAERTADILYTNEMLPRHSTQLIEGITSGSPTILPPSGGITSLPAASPPPLTPARIPSLSPATSPVETTSHGASIGRRRENTASPARHRGRTASEAGAASLTASTPRRRTLFARRRRIQTPFERSTSEFVYVENRRIKLEEDRERKVHQKETERLRLESRRLVMEENRNKILADIAKALTTRLYSSSLPSTDILGSSSIIILYS